MNRILLISATFDQPALLENYVEKLAWRRYDIGYSDTRLPKTLRAFESSSTEAFVSGTMALAENDDFFNMPFITRFLFTCTREKGGDYKLEAGFSLS